MDIESESIRLSDEILNYLIQKRQTIPSLKFWLRKRNTNKRLDQGYWFNGNDKYIHIGFSKLGGGNLSTQSIGFVIHYNNEGKPNGSIDFVFKNESDPKTVECYKEMIKRIGGFY